MRKTSTFILFISVLGLANAHSTVDPDERLSGYDFISNPQLDIYRHSYDVTHPKNTKRSIKDIPQLLHDDSFRVQFQAFNRTFHLHMEPNTDLIHPRAEIVTYDSAGNPRIERLYPQKYLIYRGIVVEPDSSEDMFNQEIAGFHSSYRLNSKAASTGWARLMVHQDHTKLHPDTQRTYEGVFNVGSETYQVQPITTYKLSKRFQDPEIVNPSARAPHQKYSSTIIYKVSDQRALANLKKRGLANSNEVGTCGSEGLGFNRNLTAANAMANHDWISGKPYRILNKRAPTAGSGCPTSKKVLYMGVAADCSYVLSYQDESAATKSILNNWNTASGVYENTFNIALGVTKLDVRSSICPSTPDSSAAWNRGCSSSYSISTRLSDFSRWRGTLGNDGTGLWHLMTNCPSGSQVGVAWLSQACTTGAKTQNAESVSGTGVSAKTTTEWKVIAHEIGHNFGAKHDCDSLACSSQSTDCCPCDGACDCKGKYLMNPTSETGSDTFSPCSVSTICNSIPSFDCLEAPESQNTIRESMCGNGIKEKGEECDCGTPEQCASDPCCTSTCKLKTGAVCSDSGDECCQGCQLKPANTTCRPAQSECDIVETCDGKSPTCPIDIFIEDGKDCGASGAGLKCASGTCTSRDAQCAARGQSAGIVKACSAPTNLDPCQFVCDSPTASRTCVVMQGVFIDGTACGVNSKCLKGSCKSGNIVDTIRTWLDRNKALGISLICIAALLLLCCLWSCCCRCVRRRRAAVYKPPPPPPPPVYNNNGYIDPSQYNGPPAYVYPPPTAYQTNYQPPNNNYAPDNHWQRRPDEIPLTNIRN